MNTLKDQRRRWTDRLSTWQSVAAFALTLIALFAAIRAGGAYAWDKFEVPRLQKQIDEAQKPIIAGQEEIRRMQLKMMFLLQESMTQEEYERGVQRYERATRGIGLK